MKAEVDLDAGGWFDFGPDADWPDFGLDAPWPDFSLDADAWPNTDGPWPA